MQAEKNININSGGGMDQLMTDNFGTSENAFA